MAQYQRKLSKGLFWFYKFDLNGKTYRSKAIYLTKQEAKKAEAKALGERNNYQKKEIQVLLVEAVSERLKYLDLRASRNYFVDSSRYLNLFYEHFGNCVFNSITRQEIQEFIMELASNLSSSKKSNYTINSAIRCYKAFFNYIIERHEIDLNNPFIKFKFFPIDKHIKYIPTDHEIESLLNVCNRKQALLIKFIMETGARINEALNLTYRDITNDYAVLYTRKSFNSNRTPRKVPLPDCFKNLNKGKAEDRVFNLWSDRPKFLEKKLKKLNQQLWGWHNLRHRYASKLSKEGKPLFEIMSLLGHVNLETTQRYLQLIP